MIIMIIIIGTESGSRQKSLLTRQQIYIFFYNLGS